MDKKLNEIPENLIPTKLTITRMVQCKILKHIKIQTYVPYNFPAFSAVNNVRNNGFTFLYALTTP